MAKVGTKQEGDAFFDFDEDILQDLVADDFAGQELISQFKRRKQELSGAMDQLIVEAKNSAVPMTKGQLEKEIG